MRELICIVCPVGCSLAVDVPALAVTGNRCPKGAVYAREEISDPKRTVTATCAAVCAAGSHMRIPVKTSSPCSKEKITLLLNDIYNVKIPLPVKAGDTVIENWNGSGINIIATRSVT